MANRKVSQFTPITALASGDYFPVVQSVDTSNKRVGVDILDQRYLPYASGVEAGIALASGNAALVDASVALASGNAALLRADGAAYLNATQTFTAAQTFASGAVDSAGSFRTIPQNPQTASYIFVAADTGKHISITTGGVTIPSGIFGAGDVVSVYNKSGSDQVISSSGGITVRQAGTANTGDRTLAQYGLATVLCVGDSEFVVSGAGLS